MLTLSQISLSRGTKQLLNKASVSLYEKQKIGLVGFNGCGKSSLFRLLLGELAPDAGEFQLNQNLRISHLSQQLPDSCEPAINYVLAGDVEYIKLQQQLQNAEGAGDDAKVLACHNRLSETGGYSKPAQAAAILAGLGFKSTEHNNPVDSFSGGWRMRLNLARCLMNPAELYLLDEPTNHLDMEAIFWLERWLKQSPATIILISHDRDFLDAFVTHILHIEHQKTILYTGDYTYFEKARAQKLALQQAQYKKQQQKIEHLMSYVERFRAKASKAKQAQSRLKAIEKIEVIALAQADSPFSFSFFPCKRAGKPLLRCESISAGYASDSPVLKEVDLSLNPGDRIALLGPNGEGKSTLIKTLTSELMPLTGQIERSPHLQIGYFAQHQMDELSCDLSPVETIQQLSPQAKEQTIRDFLGGFDFRGDMALAPIHQFSGGEKARLALAKLVWLQPNLLLLDEPTNHLDLGMRSALEIAMQQYEGALILISHDRHLLRTTVDTFYLVHNQKVQPFTGDIDDYHQWLQNRQANSLQVEEKESASSYRAKRSLQNRLKKLEVQTQTLEKALASVENELSDPLIYEHSDNKKVTLLNKKRDTINTQLKQAELDWLTTLEEIESFEK